MNITPIRCIHCGSEPEIGRALSQWGINTIVCSHTMCDGTMLVSTSPKGIVEDWNKLNTPSEGPAQGREDADND